MDMDEYVETSDVEELEEELRLREDSLLHLREGERGRDLNLGPPNSSPPRKRLKVSHEQSDLPVVESLKGLSVSPAKSLLPNHLSQSSSTTLDPSPPRWPSVSPRSPTHTPIEGVTGLAKRARSLSPVGLSQDPLLLQSPTQGSIMYPMTPIRSPLAFLPLNGIQTSGSPISLRDPSASQPKTPPFSPQTRQGQEWTTPTHTPSILANYGLQAGRDAPAPEYDDDDELLLFTPKKPLFIQTIPLSPLTPFQSRSSSPMPMRSSPVQSAAEATEMLPSSSITSISFSPIPAVKENSPLPSQSPQQDVPVLDFQIPEESRYSLRKRNIAQLNPYTVENMRYQYALKSNPEAIVKMKALERLNHRHSGNHYEPDGETQQDLYLDDGAAENPEDTNWEEKERRRIELRLEKKRRRAERQSRSASAENDTINYPDILKDLTDSDDEGMSSLDKEARKAARKKLKEERTKLKGKQREKDDKVHKPRRFPKPYGSPTSSFKHRRGKSGEDVEMSEEGAVAGPSRLPLSQNAENRALHDYFQGYDDFGFEFEGGAGPSNYAESRKSSVAPPSARDNVFEDLFDDDMNMQQDEWGEGLNDVTERTSPRLTPPVGYNVESDAEMGGDEADHAEDDGNGATIEFELPPRKSRWLRKMFPPSMFKDLIKDNSRSHSNKKPTKPERRARSSILSDEEDSGPLLPGQTRVQKSANPKDIRDIKGDTESESDIEDAKSSTPVPVPAAKIVPRYKFHDSDSDDVVEILDTYRPGIVQPVQNVEEEVFTSEDEFDDDDIYDVFFPVEKDEKVKHEICLRNESLIDYMLTKCRFIGGERKKPAAPRRPAQPDAAPRQPSKFKLDITTREARNYGRERQTLLSFDKPRASKKTTWGGEQHAISRVSSSHSINDHLRDTGNRNGTIHHRITSSNRTDPTHAGSSKSTHRPSHRPPRHGSDDDIDAPNPMEEYLAALPNVADERKVSYKEKEKARRERAKLNGIWSNNNASNQVITSGVRKRPATPTVEINYGFQLERSFQLALAPKNHTQVQREHWSKQFKPPLSPPCPRLRKGPPNHVDDDNITEVVKPKGRKTLSSTLDMGIHVLPSGKSFTAKTNIGKGWLFELVNVASGTHDPVQPLPVTLCGHSLDSIIGLEALCDMLPQITDSFFEYVTALPDLDQNILDAQWTTLAHVVSQHISWFLKSENDQETATLRDVAERQVSQILKRIHELAVKVVDIPTMTLGWFAVEISVRLTTQKVPANPDSAAKLLKTSAALLMDLLLQFDIRKAMKPVLKASNFDGTNASQFAAELWVSLIHVFTVYAPTDITPRTKSHPFWPVLLEILRTRADKENLLPWHASENAWYTIFSVCALSQFSTHGTTLGQARLTAHWDSAIFCFKRITLEGAPGDTPIEALKRRDNYVAIVVKRCMLLHERWGWKLHDPSGIFNELAGIFRSRKFANLYQEQGDFPDFLKLTDTSLLSISDPRDTAYMTFLKLIVRAAREDPVYITRKSSPKVKKWLSMAVPVGDVPLPKDMAKEEVQHFLSMFYNRLAAVSVAVELDPTEYADRTEKARHYINFASADPTTRFAIVRGLIYWSTISVARNVKLSAIAGWIEDMATIVRAEFRMALGKTQMSHAILFIELLITAVRRIIETHMRFKVYPDPSLIVALKPILFPWTIDGEGNNKRAIEQLQVSFGLLGIKLFEARDLVSHRPSRPPPYIQRHEESQESQDFGMDDFRDFDWDNIDLPAELADNRDLSVTTDAAANDQLLLKALETVQFRTSMVVSFLQPRLRAPLDQDFKKGHEAECDKWLRLFLCCSSLETKSEKWPECLRRLDSLLPTVDIRGDTIDSWVSRVRLSIMYQLFQLDPMAYMVTESRAVQVFLLALVSDHIALEKEYVAHFLSIAGLRHPLLHAVGDIPAAKTPSGDYEFSLEQYLEVRVALLRGIFGKVDQTIQNELGGDQTAALDVANYLELIQVMFSTMRSRLKSLTESAQKRSLAENEQKRDSYRDFCHNVYLIFKDCPHLFAHQRLEAWCKWGRGLLNNL